MRQLVRDHHERLDGSGYPRGLSADQIDLDTRILTVCDVYDALISKRVYRGAWSHDEAMALLRRETEYALDERCVAALEQVIAREQGTAAPAELVSGDCLGGRGQLAAGGRDVAAARQAHRRREAAPRAARP